MTEFEREELWYGMLTSEMSVLYWGHLARRYYIIEKWLKIFLASTASATVAGWTLWKQYQLAWQLLSAVSAVLAVALPILDLRGRMGEMIEIRFLWHELTFAYQSAWAAISAGSRVTDHNLDLIRERVAKVSQRETTLPNRPALIKKCQLQIIERRGLDERRQNGQTTKTTRSRSSSS